ncbi:uncharacterized protein K460DRAFT_361956 [Cucurbitaria berberidis CBS 394.84]|uniref:Uncharacterized protein n=1 Tax=Cucurbitaria berberidis CBS 394.84 TaxID=1168544 RepID=A0A9P4GTS3_9PLEO|nr:uncharacterized protein K460DRAFT_361956 [Cucurbitaria berberidis CBS 394.84]KAF1851187.1 hypothetical protein K460DRAFT_361956 [Cucurbitaria berberidis CBS 394.84]
MEPQQLLRWIDKQEIVQIDRLCLHALCFPQLRSSADQVTDAHRKTFSWTFHHSTQPKSVHQSKFRRWLGSDESKQNTFLGFLANQELGRVP